MGFWLRKSMERIDLEEEDLRPEPQVVGSLLDRSKASVGATLDQLRGNEISLENTISEASERLRQVRVAIAAFSSAEAVLKDERVPQLPQPSATEQRVPRIVRGVNRETAAADEVVANGIVMKHPTSATGRV
ncbi:hypothetical protein [Mesorhizobium sp. ANAO-SY3R2]|uniref:hypothetical protein n=1 Tax=Mesorhizobium sp. ANAO-SY3R2 TaxID=3166644 RepID=UPI003672DC2F